MATWDDVSRLAALLPEIEERSGEHSEWRVRNKPVAWERPLRKRDLDDLGDAAPQGPILAVRTTLVEKEALLAEDPAVFFTVTHFDGYPAILIRLDQIGEAELREVLTEAWLIQAPKRLAATFLRDPAAG
ncbi:hypothetical protein F4553_001286 [Allocatelliglobosispora scoriae]|uniref:MmcQ/YjbR family DNA-binding protein n=1 Tax=Allocatelliglobosispora scoriae TaxID=643052 RepID=A0A841BFP1_9ACTN|nr:MmcQ/YjbR family DNA-binding protein [Allocatelliglobosispora scoriae]MBB5867907.1 hypothetical protein [Allocatelliglobosispora scoriae]